MRPLRNVAKATSAVLFLSVASLHAQSASEIATARAFAVEGITLADKGECPAAIEKLKRAESLFSAPTSLGRLGECQVDVGLLVAGTENLQRVARAPLAGNAPAAFKAAQERARKALERALPRIGHLSISVKAGPGVTPVVRVDGETVPPAMLDADRLTDPGQRLVDASAPGMRPASQRVDLKEGGTEKVTLVLEPDPSVAAPPSSAAPASSAQAPPPSATAMPVSSTPISPPPASPSSGTRVVPFVLLGVGAVGVGLGSIFGVVAGNREKTLEMTCPAKSCPQSAQSDLDSARSKATISTVAFGVGGAALAAGIVLLLIAPSSDTQGASIGVDPAGRSAFLRGRF